MNGWERDKRWSDIYIPVIKSILAQYLIGIASLEDDRERNTDLIVLTIKNCRIAVRIRRSENSKYKQQFTIRSSRPSGMKTEFEKIMEGWGDYFFYGFVHPDFIAIQYWLIGDLEVFRKYIAICRRKGFRPWIEKRNTDGSSDFHIYEAEKIPGFIVVSNHLVTSKAA